MWQMHSALNNGSEASNALGTMKGAQQGERFAESVEHEGQKEPQKSGS